MSHTLDPDERAILIGIIRDHPRANAAQVAKIFAVKSGRSINIRSAYRSIHVGYCDHPHHLSPADREILMGVIAEIGPPDYNRTEIAAEFSVRAGRPITQQSVSKILLRNLGFPSRAGRSGKSTIAGSVAAPTIASRFEAVSRARHEAEPDRRLNRVSKREDRI